MCLTLQPDAPLHRLSCPGFWIQEVFYWPAGNSGVKAGQKTDGYRRDKADVHCNVIHVATAWIMPAPIGPVAEEDFLVGAQKHHCCGCIFCPFHFCPRCRCGRQRPQGTFCSFLSAKIICQGCSWPRCLTPCTTSGISQPLSCLLSRRWAILIKLGQENCFRKWLPVAN